MTIGEIITGQRQNWSLVKKLGEGDAGEVYLVESLVEREAAILKRPCRSALASDLLRQTSQIKTEGKILKVLERKPGSRAGIQVQTPALLDQSPPGTEYGDRLFIIVERAPGVDLNSLARASKFSCPESDSTGPEDRTDNQLLLDRVAELGEVPELILLQVLSGLLFTFKNIHEAEAMVDGIMYSGVIWNDVKPEHIFWDSAHHCLTLIDWGNGQFLEENGGTRDRRFSKNDDYYQLIQEMGRFLADANPSLKDRLDWPEDFPASSATPESVQPLQQRISARLEIVLDELRRLRRAEQDLAHTGGDLEAALPELGSVQAKILEHGEIPDLDSPVRLLARLAEQYSSDNKLENLKQVCEDAKALLIAKKEDPQLLQKWDLLLRIANAAERSEPDGLPIYFEAMTHGIHDDWLAAFWELHAIFPDLPLPVWLEEFGQWVRQLHLGVSPDFIEPYIAVNRAFYTLQAHAFRKNGPDWQAEMTQPAAAEANYESLMRFMKEEVVNKWSEREPAPPFSGIEYNDIDSLLAELEGLSEEIRQNLDKVLVQPRAQADNVIEAWRRKDFDAARRGLRTLLLWDPHRRRILQADQAILSASRWLVRVRQGTLKGEAFQDFLTQAELSGRGIRNQVGAAPWLDIILDALKRMRNGARPADLLIEHPELLNDIPWLNEHQSRETLSLLRQGPLDLKRENDNPARFQGLRGVKDGVLGTGQDVELSESLDTWAPEARGSSARVFAGRMKDQTGKAHSCAIKIMRPGQANYALPLFREEARILTILRDIPGITSLYEVGFLQIEGESQLPGEERQSSAEGLKGRLQRYGIEDVQNFLSVLDSRVDQGWLPYLALAKESHQHNLMMYCDAGHTHGQFLPLVEGLFLAIQICDILQVAHDRNIAYRDHKILHYYWDPAIRGVSVIDWNIAKRYPEGLTAADRQFDLVQFGARALHPILTGRSAPGALPLGPNRFDEVEEASRSYQVNWTYDDERLPQSLKDIVERILTGGYTQVRDLREELHRIYQQLKAAQDSSS